jgi:hypothetical protein
MDRLSRSLKARPGELNTLEARAFCGTMPAGTASKQLCGQRTTLASHRPRAPATAAANADPVWTLTEIADLLD